MRTVTVSGRCLYSANSPTCCTLGCLDHSTSCLPGWQDSRHPVLAAHLHHSTTEQARHHNRDQAQHPKKRNRNDMRHVGTLLLPATGSNCGLLPACCNTMLLLPLLPLLLPPIRFYGFNKSRLLATVVQQYPCSSETSAQL